MPFIRHCCSFKRQRLIFFKRGVPTIPFLDFVLDIKCKFSDRPWYLFLVSQKQLSLDYKLIIQQYVSHVNDN